jgi:hypothetical protein
VEFILFIFFIIDKLYVKNRLKASWNERKKKPMLPLSSMNHPLNWLYTHRQRKEAKNKWLSVSSVLDEIKPKLQNDEFPNKER